MDNQDKKEFVRIMTGVAEMYGKKNSQELLQLYFSALEKYDIDDVRRAFNAHVVNPDNGQFMPKPADIVRHIDGSTETAAMLAWSKAIKAVGRVGPWESVCFDDPIIHAVIEEMGGWILFCSMSDNDVPFKSNEFVKRYRGAMLRGNIEYPKKLIGSSEHGNNIAGYKSKAPMLIGDQQKAQLVLENGSSKKPLGIARASDSFAGLLEKLTVGGSNVDPE